MQLSSNPEQTAGKEERKQGRKEVTDFCREKEETFGLSVSSDTNHLQNGLRSVEPPLKKCFTMDR